MLIQPSATSAARNRPQIGSLSSSRKKPIHRPNSYPSWPWNSYFLLRVKFIPIKEVQIAITALLRIDYRVHPIKNPLNKRDTTIPPITTILSEAHFTRFLWNSQRPGHAHNHNLAALNAQSKPAAASPNGLPCGVRNKVGSLMHD